MPREVDRPSCYLLAAAALAALPALADPPLELSLEGDSVVISRITPGADVAYFEIRRFSEGFVPRTERRAEIVSDEDRAGELRVELTREPPRKFIAVAVELDSGRFGVVRPAGSPGREIAFPAHALRGGPNDRLDRLQSAAKYVELLLVRPGEGAWLLSTGDGTPTDESPSSDGMVVSALDAMEPIVNGPPPPDEYENGDILVRVAPRRMEFYAVRIVR